MDLKERILTVTIQQTRQVGVSSTTMDNIARSCGISKRTLYELCPDKLTLLTEAMRYSANQQRARLSDILESSDNILDAILQVYSHVRDQVDHTAPVMVDDIRRLYPTLYQAYLEEHMNNNRQLVNMLKESQKQGQIRKNADIEAVVTGFSILIKNIKPDNLSDSAKYSYERILDESFINLIRGLATSEGVAFIDRFLEEHENNKNNNE